MAQESHVPRFCSLYGCSTSLPKPTSLAARLPRYRETPSVSPVQPRTSVAVISHDLQTVKVIREILEHSGEFSPSICSSTAREATELLEVAASHVVIADLTLSDACGVACLRDLKRRKRVLKTVLAIELRDLFFVQCAFRAGTDGLLMKPLRRNQCLATLRFLACNIQHERVDMSCPTSHAGFAQTALSDAEARVLDCFRRGLLYKEIVSALGITDARLRKLQRRIFLKLHARNRAEAVERWRGAA